MSAFTADQEEETKTGEAIEESIVSITLPETKRFYHTKRSSASSQMFVCFVTPTISKLGYSNHMICMFYLSFNLHFYIIRYFLLSQLS